MTDATDTTGQSQLAKDMQTVANAGGPIPVSKPRKRTNPLKLSLFRDGAGQFRWNMRRSGRIVAASAEGYNSAAACRQTLTRLIATITAEAYVWDQIDPNAPKKAKRS